MLCIGVAFLNLSEDTEIYHKDYYIIAADKEQLQGWARDLDDVIERLMRISLFKGLHDDFIKVKHDENGRIYELKNNSFKKYYHNVWNGFKKKQRNRKTVGNKKTKNNGE